MTYSMDIYAAFIKKREPLSAEEIWKLSHPEYYSGEGKYKGKAPLEAIEAEIRKDILDSINPHYDEVGSRPARFYPRSLMSRREALRFIGDRTEKVHPQSETGRLEEAWQIRDYKRLIRCLSRAAGRVGRHYVRIPVFQSSEPKFRERVYCYELYHQLRNILGDSFPYKLDGELDKAGHSIVSRRIGAKKPDYVVHVPGRMDRNLAVIEVKSTEFGHDDLVEDINTLKSFIDEARYYGGIMLVYGNRSEKQKEAEREFAGLERKYRDRLILMLHSRVELIA